MHSNFDGCSAAWVKSTTFGRWPMVFSCREAVYTFRSLSKQPFLSALAVLSVAFGIGANSAFFGLIDLLILRPVAISHPEELVKVSTVSPTDKADDDRLLLSMFQALHEGTHPFVGMFAWNDVELSPGVRQVVKTLVTIH